MRCKSILLPHRLFVSTGVCVIWMCSFHTMALASGPCAFLTDSRELIAASQLLGEYAISRSYQECELPDDGISNGKIETVHSLTIIRSNGRRVRHYRCFPSQSYAKPVRTSKKTKKRRRSAFERCQEKLDAYLRQGQFKKLPMKYKSPSRACALSQKSHAKDRFSPGPQKASFSTYWLKHKGKKFFSKTYHAAGSFESHWLPGHRSLLIIHNMESEEGERATSSYYVRHFGNTRGFKACFHKNTMQIQRWQRRVTTLKPVPKAFLQLIEGWRKEWVASARHNNVRRWRRWYHRRFYHLDAQMTKYSYMQRSARKARKYRTFWVQVKEPRLVSQSPTQVVIQFRQLYKRRDLADHGIKQLVWRKERGKWRVFRESWIGLMKGSRALPLPRIQPTPRR